MKATTIIAAAALALAPFSGTAQTATDGSAEDSQVGGTPTAGGVSGEPLPIFQAGSIPDGAIIAGGLILIAGVVIGVLAIDNDSSSPTTTPTTNGG
ncbi:MAG: hypothetical protein AAF415_05455 [Pseudomonadota bacterium]